MKHVLARDPHSPDRVDWFAVEYGEVGEHNGPRCVVCGESWCEHCEPDRANETCPGPL